MSKQPFSQIDAAAAADLAAVISVIWFAVVTAGRAVGWCQLDESTLDEIEAQADRVADRIDRRLSK